MALRNTRHSRTHAHHIRARGSRAHRFYATSRLRRRAVRAAGFGRCGTRHAARAGRVVRRDAADPFPTRPHRLRSRPARATAARRMKKPRPRRPAERAAPTPTIAAGRLARSFRPRAPGRWARTRAPWGRSRGVGACDEAPILDVGDEMMLSRSKRLGRHDRARDCAPEGGGRICSPGEPRARAGSLRLRCGRAGGPACGARPRRLRPCNAMTAAAASLRRATVAAGAALLRGDRPADDSDQRRRITGTVGPRGRHGASTLGPDRPSGNTQKLAPTPVRPLEPPAGRRVSRGLQPGR